MRRQLLDQWREYRVEEDVGALCVVQDILYLFGKQARVDRVQDAAGTGDAVIDFEMPIAVPGERRNALAMSDVEGVQGAGKLLGPPRHAGKIGAMEGAFGIARDDLALAVIGRRV